VGVEGSDFAGRADEQRRAGRLSEAEQIAREGLVAEPGSREGVLVLALVLLEQDRHEEAQRTLESWCAASLSIPAALPAPLASEPFAAELSESEFERAFEDAETDREQMIDTDTIAERAIEQAERTDEDLGRLNENFATGTVADLLERQGDVEGATRIRARLADAVCEGTDPGLREPRQPRPEIRELERWLVNLRGGAQ
jgi:hypothetical protein